LQSPTLSGNSALQMLTVEDSMAPFESAYDCASIDWTFLNRNPHILPMSKEELLRTGCEEIDGQDYKYFLWYGPFTYINVSLVWAR
jgi:hypothetical protein